MDSLYKSQSPLPFPLSLIPSSAATWTQSDLAELDLYLADHSYCHGHAFSPAGKRGNFGRLRILPLQMANMIDLSVEVGCVNITLDIIAGVNSDPRKLF